jgi:hypothetical protein
MKRFLIPIAFGRDHCMRLVRIRIFGLTVFTDKQIV